MPNSDDYKPITCRHCGRQLALATPERLLFSMGCCCDEPVALKCTTCGARRYWRPLRAVDERAILELAPA